MDADGDLHPVVDVQRGEHARHVGLDGRDAWSILGGMVSGVEPWASWLDMARTTEPLLPGTMDGDAWLRLGVSVAVWVALPLAADI